MPKWTTMTLEEQREEPLSDLCESISAYMQDNFTKREVMEWIWDTDCFVDPPEITRGEDRRTISRKQVGRYVDTGNPKKNTETAYTYYPNGDVEDITITKRDGEGEITEQYTIHHYQDGRQPARIEG